jgi:hypothetical protein
MERLGRVGKDRDELRVVSMAGIVKAGCSILCSITEAERTVAERTAAKQQIARWRMKMSSKGQSVPRAAVAFLALVVGVFFIHRTAGAAPVEYVRVCSADGAGYFYIPGTDACVNANQIAATQGAIAANTATAYQGIAISAAMVSPFMPSNANFAVSGNWANFAGKDGFGLSGLARVSNTNFFLSAGFGASPNGGPTVQRAGFMFAW